MYKILGIDPGATTGIAMVGINEKRPSILHVEETKDVTLQSIIKLFEECDIVVCEDFLVRPGKAESGAFNWSSMGTLRIIGAASAISGMLGKPFVLQQPSIKPVGYGFSNQKYVPKKKGMHIQDATAHAVYYAVRQKLAVPVKIGR